MKGFFRTLYGEVRGLHQSAYILAFFSLASQLLALLRDRLFAHYFGAGTDLDIYYAAFRIPDFLFVLFASVLSVYVLIPFVAERTENGNTEGARRLLSNVLTVFFGVYAVVAAFVALAAPHIASFLFPGFRGEHQDTLVLLMRILLVQPFLLGVSGLFSVITQTGQRFIVYALSPLLYNGGIIFGLLVLFPQWGIAGIAAGVVIGAFFHMAVQLPLVRVSPIAPRLTRHVNVAEVGLVLWNSLPRALTLSLGQIVLLAFAGIASGMAAGSLSVFQFALNLQSVPLSIIGVSYSVAAFPILANLFSKGEHKEFVERVELALRHLLFWIIPITALIIVLRAQFVRVVLGSGAFDWQDTRLTAAALALFSLSLVAQAINLLVVRAFYAGGNTRTPFMVTVFSTAATLVVSFGLYVAFVLSSGFSSFMESLLRVSGIAGTEIMMLPLGYSLVLLVHAAYLMYRFRAQFGMSLRTLVFTAFRALVAAIGGGFAAYLVLNLMVALMTVDSLASVLTQGAVAGVAGLTVIVLILALLRSPELIELWAAFRRLRFVTRVLGPDNVDTLVL